VANRRLNFLVEAKFRHVAVSVVLLSIVENTRVREDAMMELALHVQKILRG